MLEFRKKTLSGVVWSTFAQVVRQSLQFGISIILARLLTPEDFGLIGMITVFIGFAGLFSELGFGAALIQNQTVQEQHYSSVFWLNIVMGLVLTGLFVAAAPLVATFYNEPRLYPLTMLMAVNFLITPFSTVQNAIFSRALHFRPLALIEIMAVAVAGVVAIILAVAGYGVWSLVWQLLTISSVRALVLWKMSSWRPRLLFNRSAAADLLGYSSNLLAFNVLNYWVRNGDNLLVGKFIGTVGLGIYTRAYSIMLLPVSQVTHVLSRVMFPVLSGIQNDKMLVKRVYLRSVAMIALLTFPMMTGLLVVAEHLVLALYGPKWVSVIPLLRIFSLLGMVQSIGATVGWIYQSQGRTDLMFRWGLGAGTLLIGSIAVGVWIGTIEAVAMSYAFVSGVLLPYPLFSIPGKLIDMTFGDVVRSVAGILACAIAMAVILSGISLLLPSRWPHWAYLVVEVPLGAIVYGVLIHFLDVRSYREAKELLAEQLVNRRVLRAKVN